MKLSFTDELDGSMNQLASIAQPLSVVPSKQKFKRKRRTEEL